MDSHLQHLLQVGVLTGSRAFNCATAESDWDIVILRRHCPVLTEEAIEIISNTNFIDDSLDIKEYYDDESNTTFSIAGYDLSDHPEFEDEPFIGYDKPTIWGPIQQIIKYYAPFSEEVINLFVYDDKDAGILPKFVELNNLMNFIYGHEISDKPKRIEAFIKMTAHVGITSYPN